MHLKSITLKGFKSFPDRTRLEFGSGVSVIVGPNGSGKSNITDAVLWALGEQSALAVRGQTMQDVIFAGGAGARSRSSCDVEVVIDNSDGSLSSEFSEISIARHIDRSGEGVYRLNGARCRLVDVIEVLSDSGLGKEMHSVISQGRVEQIIHSKPHDRTVLIEEAAGLSKHRKRRRRAQLKLERTQDNLSRALDIEREARSHLRPLKRQAEAAELHARVERQSLELRGQLTHDTLLAVRAELAEAERAAGEARSSRDRLEAEQGDVGRRREQTERGLAEHGKERERLSSRLFATRSAAERIAIRLESVESTSEAVDARLERSRKAIETIGEGDGGSPDEAGASGLEALEAELNRLDTERDARLAVELQGIERERQEAEKCAAELGAQVESKSDELDRAERAADEARERRRRAAEQAEEAARRRAALELELASIVERQQLVAGGDGPSLAQKITAERGFEAALAAALGGRLTALLVEDLRAGARAIERSAPEGARVLVKGRGAAGRRREPPTSGSERLIEHVSFEPEVRELVERLLDDAWVVGRIEDVPDDFEGIAVTRAGIAYRGHVGEVRRLPVGGAERVLAERSRRGQIEAELELIAADAKRDGIETEQVTQALRESEEACESLQATLRELRRAREEALEEARRAGWLSERRRELGSGPDDTRRAELMGEIAAERRLAEGLSRERSERQTRRRRLEAGIERDGRLLPDALRLGEALQRALEATHERRAALEQELSADEAVGEQAAAELRRLAQSEYDLQARLREASELLTQEEVRVAQIRDRDSATAAELAEISQKLGQDASGEQSLTVEERAEIEARLERLERRRERIGPVNPLAEGEYQEALEHVEDLERQRKDLEAALAELESLIRETDRRIRESFHETFEVTARHFEEVIQHLFPGGRGRLRLVKPPQPRVVLGGADAEPDEEQGHAGEGSAPDPEAAMIAGDPATDDEPRETPGVEIEVTPAGKSTKRLSLLSGGEKSLVALGFLFAVFLARPCPFYILDEVEAALDDLNIDRFLRLVRGYADRSQFIVITHQRRTMEAADVLYGVSMGGDGISKVVSRRLESEPSESGEPLTEAA